MAAAGKIIADLSTTEINIIVDSNMKQKSKFLCQY